MSISKVSLRYPEGIFGRASIKSHISRELFDDRREGHQYIENRPLAVPQIHRGVALLV